MNQKQTKAAVEAMLFAAGDPVSADKLAAALFAAAQRNTLGTQRVEIGLGLRSGARGYRLIRKARQLAEIHINIDHRNAVSAFDKSGGYLAARRERNISFGAEPACKNKNIHHCFLSYNAQRRSAVRAATVIPPGILPTYPYAAAAINLHKSAAPRQCHERLQ
mgnify:CR=1 FL=1